LILEELVFFRACHGIIQLRRRAAAIIAGEAAIVTADACAYRGSEWQTFLFSGTRSVARISDQARSQSVGMIL
jgi:hypothetical protein